LLIVGCRIISFSSLITIRAIFSYTGATSSCSKASRSSQAEKNNNCGISMKTTTTGTRPRAGNQRQAIACSEIFIRTACKVKEKILSAS